MRALTLCLALSACMTYGTEMVPFRGAQITLRCPLPIDRCSVGGGLVGY